VQQQIQQGKKKIGVVFNLDTHTKGGSHWVAMFIDLEDKFLFYFNSTGEKMQPQLVKFKDTVMSQGKSIFGHDMNFYVNTVEHQRSNTECGMYCLYFIITCLLRESDIFTREDKTLNTGMTKDQLISYFTGKKTRIPDSLVEDYRKELFR
jgi:Ulp1 family protease